LTGDEYQPAARLTDASDILALQAFSRTSTRPPPLQRQPF
jgi:hypothetical protein